VLLRRRPGRRHLARRRLPGGFLQASR
jgi:hypothetical protein